VIKTIADLIAFLKRFHRHWLADPSLGPAFVPPGLPLGLAALYRELGALVEIEAPVAPFGAQDSLVAPGRLKWADEMVEFAWENQSNWSARCPPDQPAPPVYSNAADIWETERRGFVVVCESLDHFLTTLCLQEAVMSCGNLVAVGTDVRPEAVVTGELRPLWVGGQYVFPEPSHDFFVTEDRNVLVMNYAGVWVGSPVRPVGNLIVPGTDYTVLRGS
jgi:hypothetical protein